MMQYIGRESSRFPVFGSQPFFMAQSPVICRPWTVDNSLLVTRYSSPITHLFDGKPPPPKYIINEVKYNTTSSIRTPGVWRSKLTKTKHGLQMGDKWIEKNLREAITDKFKRYDILENNYKILSGISKDGDKVEIFELTGNAWKINLLRL